MASEIRKYVITGGPGTGKTTTANSLAKEGYFVVHEAAREVINEMAKRGEDAVTWQGDVHERQRRIHKMQARLEKEAEEQARKQGKKIIFLDRAIPDGIAYYKISNTRLPDEFSNAAKKEKRDYKKIFFLEKIPYKTDEIRKEPPEIAERLSELIYETYKNLGYDILIVPVLPVKKRVKFIKENL